MGEQGEVKNGEGSGVEKLSPPSSDMQMNCEPA
jgi:hypothetical protein